MRILVNLIVLLATSSTLYGQDAPFERKLAHLLVQEDTASTATSVMYVAHELEQLALEHPEEWLAQYWTSFIYTQLGLFTGRDNRLAPYLDLAQAYYEKAFEAWTAGGGTSTVEHADLLVLQAFIYSWQRNTTQDKAEQAEWNRQYRVYLAKVATVDADNPMMWMLSGLEKIHAEETRAEGVSQAKRAWRLYDRDLRSSVHPNWGKSFIQFWFGQYDLADELG